MPVVTRTIIRLPISKGLYTQLAELAALERRELRDQASILLERHIGPELERARATFEAVRS